MFCLVLIPQILSIGEIPIKASINFIEVCCQHAFSITGRHHALQPMEETVDGMSI